MSNMTYHPPLAVIARGFLHMSLRPRLLPRHRLLVAAIGPSPSLTDQICAPAFYYACFSTTSNPRATEAYTYGSSRPRGAAKRAPSTLDNIRMGGRGDPVAAYSDKVYADKLISHQTPFPPTTLSPSIQSTYNRMGIVVRSDFVMNSALSTLKDRLTLSEAARLTLHSSERRRNFPEGADVRQIAYVYFLLGSALLYENIFQRLGRQMLSIAMEIGNLQASMQLCAQENLHRDYAAPPAAWEDLGLCLKASDDWRPFSIQASRWLLNKSSHKVDEAFAMARKCFDMAEPRSSSVEELPETRIVCYAPWRVLFHAARKKGDMEVARDALEAGIIEYQDPAAYEIWSEGSNHVLSNKDDLAKAVKYVKTEIYSAEWVERTTQAAILGESVALWNIGQYHLERCGWFPCTKRLSWSNDRWLAFDWFKLHAMRCHPVVAKQRILFVALVLRDSGFFKKGSEYLQQGIKLIKQSPVGEQASKDQAMQALKLAGEQYHGESGGLVTLLMAPDETSYKTIALTAERFGSQLHIRPQMQH